VEVEEEIKAISLHVLTTNQIAVRFYEQNGTHTKETY
jgi:ribosomal protein S18 acetylase RimI-like enzyme